jgi:hypothetical protein
MLVTVMGCACQEEAICKNNVKNVEINVLKIKDGKREGSETVFVNQGINSEESIPPAYMYPGGSVRQIGWESIPWAP